jgi:putative acetyltransferase
MTRSIGTFPCPLIEQSPMRLPRRALPARCKLRLMSDSFAIRPIGPQDDAAMAAIIRTVMPSFGAVGPGFAINDPEVDFMSRAYDRPGAAFFVVEEAATGRLVGGGGIAPLDGGPQDRRVCELRKMYFLIEARGHGLGRQMLQRCLDFARQAGYAGCYLETLSTMEQAIRLYERSGFSRLTASLGDTGHHACDRHYYLTLTPR